MSLPLNGSLQQMGYLENVAAQKRILQDYPLNILVKVEKQKKNLTRKMHFLLKYVPSDCWNLLQKLKTIKDKKAEQKLRWEISLLRANKSLGKKYNQQNI